MKLEDLQESIGYQFKNKELLKNALTHTSYAYENHIRSNEKLEFLGDSILEFVSSRYIYDKYPELNEGEMTKVRAAVVCEASLYKVAVAHNFSDFLYLGKSEKMANMPRQAILADSVEAVIAAIYLDGGIKDAEIFIIRNLKEAIEEASKHVGEKDHKTVLQEELQKKGNVHIVYQVIGESGPDHNKLFTVEVSCNNIVLAQGMGSSKKMAEMQAAQKALEQIKKGGTTI